MTNEEYLRARGWFERWANTVVRDGAGWCRSPGDVGKALAEAVEEQLAEDRAALAFVLARTPPLAVSERGESAALAALGAIMEEHR